MKVDRETTYTLTLTEEEMKFLVICMGTLNHSYVKTALEKEDSTLVKFNITDFCSLLRIAFD